MANIIESAGFSLGKVHTGMLVHLCDLFHEGITEPLRTILTAFGIPVPENPIVCRESKIAQRQRVDLAIFDSLKETPYAVIEIKVDDWEGQWGNAWQTTLYSNSTPNNTHRLFITLGNGEYYRPPFDSRFTWIRLPEFFRATNAIVTQDLCIQQWKNALQNELHRREMVSQNMRDHLHQFRAGGWNITFLGLLKEALLSDLHNVPINIGPTCYTHGTRPDTILNFGWDRYPRYAEINNNGRLNVKISFYDCEDDATRQTLYQETIELIEKALDHEVEDIRGYGRISKTMTVTSLEIGLFSADDALGYTKDQAYTIGRLKRFLTVLYDAQF